MDLVTIRDRVQTICEASPFGFTRAVDPFSFDLQPTGAIDQVFRVEVAPGEVIGQFNFREERTDAVVIWIARRQLPDPERTYTDLVADLTALRAAIIRDGAESSGEYCVVDDNDFEIVHETGQEFSVARLAVPVNYEVSV